jgi:vacuolar-type H+-ATPase subunit H
MLRVLFAVLLVFSLGAHALADDHRTGDGGVFEDVRKEIKKAEKQISKAGKEASDTLMDSTEEEREEVNEAADDTGKGLRASWKSFREKVNDSWKRLVKSGDAD